MSIYRRDGGGVGNGNMLWLYSHELSVLLVGGVDREVSAAAAGLDEEPKFRKLCRERGREAAKFLVVCEVREEVV